MRIYGISRVWQVPLFPSVQVKGGESLFAQLEAVITDAIFNDVGMETMDLGRPSPWDSGHLHSS